MPDYQAMYYKLFHATEQAIADLIAAQQACEELYIQSAQDDPSDAEDAAPETP